MLRIAAFVLCEAAFFGLALPAQAVSPTGGFAGLVDIGDHRKIYLECSGQGSPTVVLISGVGALASEASRSDPVPLPVTATAGAFDL